MEKGKLVLYTYSPTNQAPPPFLLEDKNGRSIEKVCFVPPSSEDRDENGWAMVPARANKDDSVTETQLKTFSTGQFKSEFTVWVDFGTELGVNPWGLVDEYLTEGVCIAMPRLKSGVYATIRKTSNDRRDLAIANRIESALSEAGVGDEPPVNSSVIVRRQCVDLFRLERAWISEATRTQGKFVDQSFFLAKKRVQAAKFKSIADEKQGKALIAKG